jgi:integrase
MGIHLDKKTVNELTKPAIYFDDELMGYGVRVRESSKGKLLKAYVIQYRVNGVQHRLKLGDTNKLSPDQARKLASEMLAKVILGTNPAEERQTERVATSMTFSKAVAEYLDVMGRELRAASLKVKTIYLCKEKYFGDLHRLPVSKVTRSDVSSAVNKITTGSGATSARDARAHLSAFFTWCIRNDHADANPVINSVDPKVVPKRKGVVLNDSELVTIWKACEDAGEYGAVIRLMILTGCRRQEMGSLRWSWIDLDRGTITIPGNAQDGGRFQGTKNHRDLVLPISPLMREIIGSVPRMVDRDPLFGTRGPTGFTDWQERSLDADITKSWVLHDIRRSVASGLARLKVQPHVISELLNHVSGGHRAKVTGQIYIDPDAYVEEVKAALIRWSNHIGNLLSGKKGKIIQMRA